MPDFKRLTQVFTKYYVGHPNTYLLTDDKPRRLCLFYKKFALDVILAVGGHSFYCKFGFMTEEGHFLFKRKLDYKKQRRLTFLPGVINK